MKELKEKVRDIPPFGVRMPKEMREQLEREAHFNGRSLNMEIVGRLRKSLEGIEEGRATQFKLEQPPGGGYAPDLTEIERRLLTIFRRMPPEKQLALLSLFN
jgi:hypothetical protein